jgi:hypothetical protein
LASREELVEQHDTAKQVELLGIKMAHPVLGNYTLVEAAAMQFHINWVEYSLSKGLKILDDNQVLAYLLRDWYTDIDGGQRLFEQALRAGALLEPRGSPMTPLQVAVSESNRRLVSLLLQAGARPDATAGKLSRLSDLHRPPKPSNWDVNWNVVDSANKWFREFQILGDQQPLDICRGILRKLEKGDALPLDYQAVRARPRTQLWNFEKRLNPTTAREIEALLVEYGATASYTNEEYDSWPLGYRYSEEAEKIEEIQEEERRFPQTEGNEHATDRVPDQDEGEAVARPRV